MKYFLIILLSFFGLSGYSQLMQTNGTAGGYQWVASKSDSLHIIPRGSDTPAIGGTKYGKSTVAALFYKTTDSTLWIRSANKWNQVTGSGGGSVVWGDITGDITNQIDLINYVDSVIVANGGTDSLYYRGGAAVDSFFYSKDGTEYFWYANPATDRVIYGGIVTWTGTALDYYVSACYFRKNGIYYLTNDTTVTLPPLADADSSRTDVFIVQTLSDTQGQSTTVTGTESANPITPQVDGNTDLYLTSVTLNPNQTTGLNDTLIVYDNLSGGEFEYRSSTGVTTNFSNTSNVYRVPYSVDVSAINNGDIIGFGTETQRNALDYLGLSFFIKLKAVMPNSNGMLVSLWNNGVQVSNEVGIPFNRSNLSYQGFSVPMTTFNMSNAYFDSVRFRYAGGGAGITGMYMDFIYFQGNLNPGGPSTGGNNKWVTQGTAIIIDSLTTPNVYNISADTSLLSTHHYVDSSISTLSTGGITQLTGDVTAGPGSGSQVATLATVNSNVGTFTDATVTANGKGLITAISSGAAKLLISDTATMLTNYPVGGVINWPGTIYSTPTTASVSSKVLTFAPSLASQSAWKVFARNAGTSGTPSFGQLVAEHLNTTYSNGNMLITNGSGTLSWTTAGTALNGTGYVKMSGTTPSYQSNTQLTADVNTFTQTLSGAVPAPTTLNGYFLKDDGTWAAASGGTATAAGTTGNVQFKRADGVFSGVSTFQFDSANTRLGIGVSSPSYPLDVSFGSSSPTGRAATFTNTNASGRTHIFTYNGANYAGIGVFGSSFGIKNGEAAMFASSNSNWFAGDGQITQGSHTFYTKFNASSPRMQIDSNGVFISEATSTTFAKRGGMWTHGLNALIGNLGGTTADPAASGSISAGACFVYNYSTANFFGSGVSGARNSAYDIWFQTGPSNGGGYRFYKNTTELMTIYTSGNVGINSGSTDVASALLQLNSTTKGFLISKLTTTQRDAISSPATGLQIYNTTLNCINTYNGVNWTGSTVVSSAATLTIAQGNDYIFTGTTTTWTLPAISASIVGRDNGIKIKNRGSGAITLNTATGNTLYTTAATNTITINAGAAVELLPDGTYNIVQYNL